MKSDRLGGNRAIVTLLDSNSMEIVAEQICNENGEFLIQELTEGNYILVVQKPGFAKPERRFISISDKGTVVQTAENGVKNQNSASNGMM